MTSAQKIIKYLALAFAIFLCVSIIGGIIGGITFVSGLLSDEEPAGQMQVYSVDGEISSLSLKLSAAELKIKSGDQFSVESNHKYISVKVEKGRLCIDETKRFFSVSPKGISVILTVPDGFVFHDATVDTGAGKVEIDVLSADELDLSLGAGEAIINTLIAGIRADIDGGAGALTIQGGLLTNLDLDMGVGKLTLKSRILGDSKLDYGVGQTDLTLLGSREDYQIQIDKGLGDARLEGEPMQDDAVYGSGKNKIEIDGGIGAINITFASGV